MGVLENTFSDTELRRLFSMVRRHLEVAGAAMQKPSPAHAAKAAMALNEAEKSLGLLPGERVRRDGSRDH